MSNPTGGSVLGAKKTAIVTIQDDAQDVIAADIDGNGTVDLRDLIMALKVLSNKLQQSDVYKGADINGDGKIGMEEVIYILQKISGLR